MKEKEIIEQCNQIIEFWRLGYSDKEIRDKMGLEPSIFISRINRIQSDNCLATEAMLLFEKEVIKLADLYKYTLKSLTNCDERQQPALIRCLIDIVKTKIEIAQKLNAVDPQRFVIEFTDEEMKKLEAMSFKEISEYYYNQQYKWASH